MKIVVNRCYGGFGLSAIAIQEYLKLIGKECYAYKRDYKTKLLTKIPVETASNYDTFLTKDYGESLEDDWDLFRDHRFFYRDIERTDPNLISVVEMLGEQRASGEFSELEIVEIPDGVSWEIDEYDGVESIHETHRSW